MNFQRRGGKEVEDGVESKEKAFAWCRKRMREKEDSDTLGPNWGEPRAAKKRINESGLCAWGPILTLK